VIGH